jgi:D-sedoheptulose 7-phosphate isomerase
MSISYSEHYLAEAGKLISRIDLRAIDGLVAVLVQLRQRGGRLFCLGVGGGASYASHAAADFRKITGIESYAATDNVTEMTARINDDGWDSSFVEWLKGSRLSRKDCLLVFSVGGGSLKPRVSANIVLALQYGHSIGASICGIVGRDGGYAAQVADECIVIPPAGPDMVTPLTEAFQALIWHLLVSHPELRLNQMKWESLE